MKSAAKSLLLLILSANCAFSQAVTESNLPVVSSVSDSDYVRTVIGNASSRSPASAIRQIVASQITNASPLGRSWLMTTSPGGSVFPMVTGDTVVYLDAAAFLAAIGGGSGGGGSAITIREVDGSPTLTLTTLEVTNDTLTDMGSGVARLNTGGTAGGSGTLNTIEVGDSQVGDSDIVKLDFLSADFGVTESPDTEMNISIAPGIARDAEVAAAYAPITRVITPTAVSNETVVTPAGGHNLSSDFAWTIGLAPIVDLSGKTAFKPPTSSAPTVDSLGKIAVDDNLFGANRGAVEFHDGTSVTALVGVLVSDVPSAGQIPVFKAGGFSEWESFSATAPGSTNQIPYNAAGSFAAEAGFEYNPTTNTLTVPTLNTTGLDASTFKVLDAVDQSHGLLFSVPTNLVADKSFVYTGAFNFGLTLSADSTLALSGDNILFADGVRQTFNPNATTPGLNVGSQAGDPSTPSNGDVWYDSTGNLLRARINGATTSLGGAGSATAWSGIGNSSGNVTIALASFTTAWTSTLDSAGAFIFDIYDTDADSAAATGFIQLRHNDGADADVVYMKFVGDVDGTPVNDYVMSQTAFTISSGVATTFSGAVSLAGASTTTTPGAGDNDTSLATTAFVNSQTRGSNTSSHATPSTTNPLTLTFDAIMHTVWYGATGEIDLPAATGYTGRGFIIYNTGAFTITLDPNGSEIIVRDGTVQTGGLSMTLSSGAGNYVALISDGTRWITLGYKGTLSVGS